MSFVSDEVPGPWGPGTSSQVRCSLSSPGVILIHAVAGIGERTGHGACNPSFCLLESAILSGLGAWNPCGNFPRVRGVEPP